MKKKWIWLAPAVLVVFAAFIVLGGEVVKNLWNWLLPDLFGFRPLTFWQALGMLALCRILFGGFGMSSGRSRMRERFAQRWEERIAQRWEKMSPEEREKYAQYRSRIGGCGKPPDA